MAYRRRKHRMGVEAYANYGIVGGTGGGGGGGGITSSERTNNDFSGYATGAGLPTGWTENGTTTNISYAVNTNGGSPGGQSFDVTKSPTDTSRVILTKDDSSGDDMSAVLTFEADTSLAVGVYIDYDEATGNGYMAGTDYLTNNMKLYRVDGGSFTQLDAGGSITISAGTIYHVRLLKTSDNKLKGRAWADSAHEPTTWMVEATDATYSSGKFGIDIWSNKTYVAKMHRFSYGHNGNQGCIIDDDQFPDECLYVSAIVDDSLRVLDLDGDPFALIAVEIDGDPNSVAVHNGDRQIYWAVTLTGIIRRDRWGTRREEIDLTVDRPYGVTIKESTDEIFYSTRHSTTSRVYKNSKDGGSRTELWNEGGFFEVGACYYNADDDRVYFAKHLGPKAMETDGTSVQTYAAFSDNLTFVADATLAYASTWNANNHSSIPIGGGSYTSRDATSSLWSLQFNSDKTKMYACNADGNEVIQYTSMPPSAGNRAAIVTGFASAGDMHCGYANFV